MTYRDFFRNFTSLAEPHDWQRRLADEECRSRLIRVPTGFGKTLGVAAAWAYHRLHLHDERWPRRLVWCLPMRVLAEQTYAEIRTALDRLQCLWDEKTSHEGKAGVHLLMGGADGGEWHLHPEHCAVLIGTQDMLLSRALNRGYATPRARWPMEFGLLNHDSLWVMDEVQLMDVGLATSTQLQQFRDDDQPRMMRPCHTWWMSATLQADWLAKSPDTSAMATALDQSAISIQPTQRTGPLWDEDKVSKPTRLETLKDEKALAAQVAESHRDGIAGPTLVVVNRVERAVKVADALSKNRALKDVDIRLIHSRFRPAERAVWREEFLNRTACTPGTNRIIVATQVVEAGVDISAGVLFTELAPWASLVQRFGRCARWGGTAQVIVVDFGAGSDKSAAPYTVEELDAARNAFQNIDNVSPLHLETFEESHPELLPELYPYSPGNLLLRHELDELFDTSSDLSGADIDISRFIRSGDERDVYVFWEDIPLKAEPTPTLKPERDSLCPVKFLDVRDWLCGKETSSAKAPRLKQGMRAWVWDWLDGRWRPVERKDLYPGATVLVDSKCGGYDASTGWNPDAKPVRPELLPRSDETNPDDQADAAEDDESLSMMESCNWQTIAFHCRETGKTARNIVDRLAPNLSALFDLAGRWHDAGKAHPAFQGSIVQGDRPPRPDLAKAPQNAWLRGNQLYSMPDGTRRPGFRHELASTLALFAVLQRHAPDHPALRGPYRGLLEKLGSPLPGPSSAAPPTSIEQEILALDRTSFDLLTWLVCTHHGKVRMAWHSSAADQLAADSRLRIRGLREGDTLPSLILANAKGDFGELPASLLDLSPSAAGLNAHTGPGWTERCLGLLRDHGPFTLAWFEALMRAADIRTSRLQGLRDPLLSKENPPYGLENQNSGMEKAAAGSANGLSAGARPDTDLAEHGLRKGAGGSGLAEGATRPGDATRHIDTAAGRLSYSSLAEHLAEPLLRLEERIRAGEFSSEPFDQHLLLRLHAELSLGLFPDKAGQYRQTDVRVSAHEPPPPHEVPPRVLDYVRNLEARLQHLPEEPDERWLEVLAYAEGELLSIHPFPDLNGRIARLWMSELLRRLGLPPVDIVPSDPEFRRRYLRALAAADQRDWQPLMTLWQERLERTAEQP